MFKAFKLLLACFLLALYLNTGAQEGALQNKNPIPEHLQQVLASLDTKCQNNYGCLALYGQELTAIVKHRDSLLKDLGKDVRFHSLRGSLDPTKTDYDLGLQLYKAEGASCERAPCYGSPEQELLLEEIKVTNAKLQKLIGLSNTLDFDKPVSIEVAGILLDKIKELIGFKKAVALDNNHVEEMILIASAPTNNQQTFANVQKPRLIPISKQSVDDIVNEIKQGTTVDRIYALTNPEKFLDFSKNTLNYLESERTTEDKIRKALVTGIQRKLAMINKTEFIAEINTDYAGNPIHTSNGFTVGADANSPSLEQSAPGEFNPEIASRHYSIGGPEAAISSTTGPEIMETLVKVKKTISQRLQTGPSYAAAGTLSIPCGSSGNMDVACDAAVYAQAPGQPGYTPPPSTNGLEINGQVVSVDVEVLYTTGNLAIDNAQGAQQIQTQQVQMGQDVSAVLNDPSVASNLPADSPQLQEIKQDAAAQSSTPTNDSNPGITDAAAKGETPAETPASDGSGDTSGGDTTGGETNTGDANGGETNTGDANGGETNTGETQSEPAPTGDGPPENVAESTPSEVSGPEGSTTNNTTSSTSTISSTTNTNATETATNNTTNQITTCPPYCGG